MYLKELKLIDKVVLITLAFLLLPINISFAEEYQICSFNIRVDNKNDLLNFDGWQSRKLPLTNLILCQNIDILTLQEVKPNQFNDLKQMLKSIYDSYGVGRNDGKKEGECCPVFYKKSKFKLVASDTFWISQTPKKPSKGWDAQYNRICSWVLLEDIKTRKRIYIFNTHLDNSGILARKEGLILICNQIKKISSAKDNIILTGDFNSEPSSDIFYYSNINSFLKDSYEVATFKNIPCGTFNGFKTNIVNRSRIDYIWISHQIKTSRYNILNVPYFTKNKNVIATLEQLKDGDNVIGKDVQLHYHSDHFPVCIYIDIM